MGGCVVAAAKFLIYSGDALLDQIVVAREWRRKRIAAFAMLYALRTFAAPAPWMRLMVREDNTYAMKAYQALGYQQWQPPADGVWSERDAAPAGWTMMSVASDTLAELAEARVHGYAQPTMGHWHMAARAERRSTADVRRSSDVDPRGGSRQPSSRRKRALSVMDELAAEAATATTTAATAAEQVEAAVGSEAAIGSEATTATAATTAGTVAAGSVAVARVASSTAVLDSEAIAEATEAAAAGAAAASNSTAGGATAGGGKKTKRGSKGSKARMAGNQQRAAARSSAADG